MMMSGLSGTRPWMRRLMRSESSLSSEAEGVSAREGPRCQYDCASVKKSVLNLTAGEVLGDDALQALDLRGEIRQGCNLGPFGNVDILHGGDGRGSGESCGEEGRDGGEESHRVGL